MIRPHGQQKTCSSYERIAMGREGDRGRLTEICCSLRDALEKEHSAEKREIRDQWRCEDHFEENERCLMGSVVCPPTDREKP